jgi:hypothetical protein
MKSFDKGQAACCCTYRFFHAEINGHGTAGSPTLEWHILDLESFEMSSARQKICPDQQRSRDCSPHAGIEIDDDVMFIGEEKKQISQGSVESNRTRESPRHNSGPPSFFSPAKVSQSTSAKKPGARCAY